jgi:cytochrome P450
MTPTHISAPSQADRRKGEAAPVAPLPRSLQTLVCYLWPLSYLEQCRARLGDRFSIHPIDMPPLVFLCSPQDIRAILTAPASVLHPGAGGAAITPIVGESSFMLRDEDEHLRVRKVVLPALHKRVPDEHLGTVASIVEQEVASWPLEQPFPLHPRLRALTLRVILKVVFGDAGQELDALHETLLEMLSTNASPVFQEPRLRRVPPWRSTWTQFLRRRREADELFLSLIRERAGRGDAGGDAGGDILGVLLAAHGSSGGRAGERMVRDNLMSVILAGHETTATELAWAFQLIAHHPRVQSRLAAEIDGETGEEYMTATIHEVLRHRPVFLFAIPRAVVRPIEIGGWTYRPPTQLLGCIYLAHHDPALYTDPHEFRPERFLDSPLRPWTWIPWGGGRKRCPGHRLAFLEMQTVLRAVLATRIVLPASRRIERARWRSVIVTPHAGSRVVLRERRPRAR